MVRAVTAVVLAAALAPSAPAAQDGQQAGKGAPTGSPRAAPAAPAPNAASKPSPAAERVARALTTRASWNDTVDAYASALSSQISAAMEAQGGDAPKDAEKRIRTRLDDAVAYEEVVRLQAQALAGRFGEDELRAIGTFYESPPGKKLVSELPGVSRQVIEVVQQRISVAIPRIVEEIAPALARAKPGTAEGSAGSGAKDAAPTDGRKPPAQSPPRP
jgi:hypothetical protein